LPTLHGAGPSQALLLLIPNWSSPEFEAFVDAIADLVDELDIPLESEAGRRLFEVWKTTLWYEERFWQAGEVD
jgi:thiaminase